MKKKEATEHIVNHLEAALGQALSSMTGKDFSVAAEQNREITPAEQSIIWEQSFSFSGRPAFWLAAGKEFWASAGRLTLEAAGIDEVTDDDCRSTWREIIGQTMGGFAAGLTVDLQSEVTTSAGDEIASEPADVRWVACSARCSEDEVWYFRIAWSKEVAAIYEPPETAQKAAVSRDNAVSKTFDLLLDVAMPVSVSFGRTSLQIREVLKLNTGSIVELNRFVAEPVEVIVNDCVIARGEVVVVDGNYGVRITQLASREDRLRSGIAESAARIGVSPR